MQVILKTNPWSGQKCPKGGVRSMQPTRKSCLCILPASRSRNRILVRRSTLERDIFVSDVEGGGYVEKPITQLRVAFTIIAASTTLSNRLEGSPSCWFAAHIDSKGFFFACYPLPFLRIDALHDYFFLCYSNATHLVSLVSVKFVIRFFNSFPLYPVLVLIILFIIVRDIIYYMFFLNFIFKFIPIFIIIIL